MPKLLSLLAHHDPNAEVIGLESVKPADRPPVNIVRIAFQTMVAIGTGLALLGTLFFVTWFRKRRLPRSRWFYRAVMAAGPLSFVALIAGWITTEVGRQPWIVYETMRTTQAVTSADGLEVGYAVLVAVYVSLGAGVVWLLRRLTRPPGGVGGRALMLPELCLGLVILGVTAYAVLGSADFGAGFWDLTAGGAERGGRVRGMIERSMSPVWEANHVWLIFVLVIVWTAFPVAFGSIFSTLSIPLFLAALGIIFRGAAFALRGHAATINEARGLGALFALSSVLIPFFLGAAIGGVASGRVKVGNAAGRAVRVVAEPDLGADRRDRRAQRRLSRGRVPRRRLAARGAAGPRARVPRPRARHRRASRASSRSAGCSCCATTRAHLYDGLTSGGGLAMVIVSALAGAVTLALVWTERYGPGAADLGARRRRDRGRLGARPGPVLPARRAHARAGGGRRRGARRRCWSRWRPAR